MDDFNRLMGNLTKGEAIRLMHKAFDLGLSCSTQQIQPPTTPRASEP